MWTFDEAKGTDPCLVEYGPAPGLRFEGVLSDRWWLDGRLHSICSAASDYQAGLIVNNLGIALKADSECRALIDALAEEIEEELGIPLDQAHAWLMAYRSERCREVRELYDDFFLQLDALEDERLAEKPA
ncbi:hypothetical protein GGE65_008063 [Skermanella aerolata]|uniref:hypothetical protein n=1 Tax=Skermanella aerolata TaxID=393310 RepID=UPI003D24F167